MNSARTSRLALCLALLCVAAPFAQALHLGETREQLLARHGAPGAEDHARNTAAYFWDGWSAQLELQGNVVRKITYRRNWYLQDAEIMSLLESNGGASHWRETSTPDAPARQWTRADGAFATCGRAHPLSIVFQAAGLAAQYQQGPKIVSAAASDPNPSALKTPTFPKLLDAEPEPELPVAAPPSLRLSPAPSQQGLPKLQTTELEPEAKPAPAAEETREPLAPESRSKPAAEQKPAVEPPHAAPVEQSHVARYILGSLGLVGLLGILIGGGLYFRKTHPRSRTAPIGKVVAKEKLRDTAPAASGLEGLRTDQAELLVGEIFRREGYTVELSAAVNTQDGIDLMLRRNSETTLVQCKHWKAAHVSSREIHEFYGAMAASGAHHGILVTTGEFTADAAEFAKGKGIELVDGVLLGAVMAGVAKPGEDLSAISAWLDDFVAHARIFDPECPVCQRTMVIRHHRANGTPSWSCPGYPRCPGKREPRLDLLAAAAAHH